MPIYGSATPSGAPVQFRFNYNGTVQDWGSSRLLDTSIVSNSADPVDNNYKVGNLSCRLIDTDGSVWTALGAGTTCLRKPLTITYYVGGTSTPTTLFDGVVQYSVYGTSNAYTGTLFDGRVSSVSRRDRVVTIKGENYLRQLSELRFQWPVTRSSYAYTKLGSYFFGAITDNTYLVKLNLSEDKRSWEGWGYMYSTVGDILDTYPAISGRTQGDWVDSDYFGHPGTQFYLDNPKLHFTGSWLGTYSRGTITTTEEAWSYGFASLQDAEAAKAVTSGEGTHYPINKYRFHFKGTSLPQGSRIHWVSPVTLENTPGSLFRWLTTSRLVEPLFSDSNVDSGAINVTHQVMPNYTFAQVINPDEDDVYPYLKDLFLSSQALFHVTPKNELAYRAFGPVDLSTTPPSILQGDVIDATVENNLDNYVNRVVFQYDYNQEDDIFKKVSEKKSSDWTRETDQPLELKSKWVHSVIDAETVSQRILSRFLKTRPMIQLTVPMKFVPYGVGTVLDATEQDSFGASKRVQVTGVEIDLDKRQVELTLEDADSLYRQRGYARWEAGSGTVAGTHKSGWSNGGTVLNINTSLYGTIFRWF